MKMRRIFLAMLAVSTFALTVSSNSSNTVNASIIRETPAAKCRIPPFKEAYAGAKAVFTGTVTDVVQSERGKVFEFQVEKYWKGNGSKKISVMVYESSRFQAFYQNGKSYLVFASADDGGGLRDGRCSRSNDIADAASDLKALGKGKRPR